MKYLNVLIIIMLVTLCANSFALSNGYTWYKDPISFKPGSIDVASVIERGLKGKGWEIKSSTQGKIVGFLNNHRGYNVIIDITYTDSKIEFGAVSAESLKCRKCEVKESKYSDWLFFLRKAIAKYALYDLVYNVQKSLEFSREDPDVHPFASENPSELKKYAQFIYKYGQFELDDLDVGAERLYRDMNDASLADHMAWICKVLGESKNPRYKKVIEDVLSQTNQPKVVKYAERALKSFPESDDEIVIYKLGSVKLK